MEFRERVQIDVLVWNLNCFLAKNVTHNHLEKEILKTEGLFFIETVDNVNYIMGEMMSPSRFYLREHSLTLEETLEKLKILYQSKQLKHLIVGKNTKEIKIEIPLTNLKDSTNWTEYLEKIKWPTANDKNGMTNLKWDFPLSLLSVQICNLCNQYNFI